MENRFRITGLGLRRVIRVLAGVLWSWTVVAARTALARSERSAPEEALPAVFQPETLLPLQYYETLRRRHELEGEKLLMFAVLKDAVEGYMKYLHSTTRKGQKRFREAEDWIDREDKLWLFSFDSVCQALDIEPEYMRRGLHQWKQAHLEPAARASGR